MCYLTSHFLILPYGVVNLSYNEAIQTILLELGFHHSPGTLYRHIPPNGSVLLKRMWVKEENENYSQDIARFQFANSNLRGQLRIVTDHRSTSYFRNICCRIYPRLLGYPV
jgi:hypothetical protein